ncbi:hypothetical protein OQA88_5205 [Cercophora sp. LCS_1]
MPTLDFITVDVFTTTRFEGNPLAVIPDARGLSSTEMQRIATEFNYSETTFVLPPADPSSNDANVRIFTPTTEVPFAGHPNVGTAFVLGQQPSLFGKAVSDTLRFEEKAGIVTVSLARDDSGSVTSATIRAPGPLKVGKVVSLEIIARCASIATAQISIVNHAPVIASVGLAFAFAELTSLEALGAARPNVSEFHIAAGVHGDEAESFPLFLYVRDKEDPWRIRARMFAPLDNVMEDPATGSASAALGALLVSRVEEQDVTIKATIEQGVEMGRRSAIELEVRKEKREIKDVFVSGSCVRVMKGSVEGTTVGLRRQDANVMSGIDILGAASAALALLESAIALAARLREAQQRRKGLADVIQRHDEVLSKTRSIITLVKDETALQTAAVADELSTLDTAIKGLVDVLSRIRTSGSGKRQNRLYQFAYQFVNGSRDEADLQAAMANLGRAKDDLSLSISVAHVGVSRGMQDTLVLNTRLLERVDAAVRAASGEDRGLLIGKLVQGRHVPESGTLFVTARDLASISHHHSDSSTRMPTANDAEQRSRHIVARNMTADQALQINGPIGNHGWHASSHVVQDNKATGSSAQINGAMSVEAFSALLGAR